MTKTQLQQELLEKVKPGTKPSDIKKQVKSQISKNQDDGYESDRSDKSVPIAPPLPNQDLLSQINSLQKQLQLYKDFREGDLKIKEGYKESIKELTEENSRLKTIADLKNQPNSLRENKQETDKPKEPKLYFFTCDICEQNKKSQLHLGKVNGLGVDPLKENKICDSCIRKVDLIQPPKEDFF
jgi:hypothetical protein